MKWTIKASCSISTSKSAPPADALAHAAAGKLFRRNERSTRTPLIQPPYIQCGSASAAGTKNWSNGQSRPQRNIKVAQTLVCDC